MFILVVVFPFLEITDENYVLLLLDDFVYTAVLQTGFIYGKGADVSLPCIINKWGRN